MARKQLDCSECGAEYTITSKEQESPEFCPFCGDPSSNVIEDRFARGDEDDEDEDFDGYSIDEDDE